MPIEYSVLSDSNKRLLYDVGVYDSEDDEADVTTRPNSINRMSCIFLRDFGQEIRLLLTVSFFAFSCIRSCRGWATSSERWPT